MSGPCCVCTVCTVGSELLSEQRQREGGRRGSELGFTAARRLLSFSTAAGGEDEQAQVRFNVHIGAVHVSVSTNHCDLI